jgi:hypothetical protein
VFMFDRIAKKVDYNADPLYDLRRCDVLTCSVHFYDNEEQFMKVLDENKIVLYKVFENGKTDTSITAKFVIIEKVGS